MLKKGIILLTLIAVLSFAIANAYTSNVQWHVLQDIGMSTNDGTPVDHDPLNGIIDRADSAANADVASDVQCTDCIGSDEIALSGPCTALETDASGTITCGTDDVGSSLWASSGSNVYRSSGNVGIGTTNPQARLQVNGNLRFPGLAACTLKTDGSGYVQCGTDQGVWAESSGNVYRISGNVGILNSAPDAQLHVGNSNLANPTIRLQGTGTNSWWAGSIEWHDEGKGGLDDDGESVADNDVKKQSWALGPKGTYMNDWEGLDSFSLQMICDSNEDGVLDWENGPNKCMKDWNFGSDGTFGTYSLDVYGPSGTLKVGSLGGSGNAYACLNAEGALYRSSTPCA